MFSVKYICKGLMHKYCFSTWRIEDLLEDKRDFWEIHFRSQNVVVQFLQLRVGVMIPAISRGNVNTEWSSTAAL
jgi:hypothetical protein